MHTVRVAPSEVAVLRMQAEYYNPNCQRVARLIRDYGDTLTLESVRDAGTPIRRGIDMPRLSLEPNAPRLITIAAFDDPGLSFEGLEGIDPQQHDDFRGSHVRPGDLLVAMGGYVGRAAICPTETPSANIGRHSARVVVDPSKANKYFIWAFICSRLGQVQFQREVTGSVQAGINLEDLREIPIPAPCSEVQDYIGDKVRQAERLRERARALQRCAEECLSAALGTRPAEWLAGLGVSGTMSSGGFRTRVPASQIRARLDPDGYHPELREIAVYASRNRSLFRRLPDLANIVTDSRERLRAGPSVGAYISILHVDTNGFVNMSEATIHMPDTDGRECMAGDVLLSGINPSANRIAACPQSTLRIACSPEFSILRPTGEVQADYLAFAMRSIPCFHQLIHLGQGTSSSRRRIEEIELGDVWVPVIPEHEEVGRQIASQQTCVSLAGLLTSAAKLLVEALIEGIVTEAELKNAQEALQRGDTSPDREILGRLKMFPNLDDLYAALDESADASVMVEARG